MRQNSSACSSLALASTVVVLTRGAYERRLLKRPGKRQPLRTRGYERVGKPLEGKALLEILDVFGEEGLRAYILGHTEGSDDAEEED